MAWKANIKRWSQQKEAVEQPTFEDVFEAYYRPVYHYLYYRVHCAHLTEDLTSQVFEKVLTGISQYRSDAAPFEVWLFAIAKNVVADHYRREKVKSGQCSLAAVSEQASFDLNPAERLEGIELREQLLDAVKELNPVEQNLIALKFGGGLKNIQIAKLLEMSESNVGVTLYRAMKKLKDKLEREV